MLDHTTLNQLPNLAAVENIDYENMVTEIQDTVIAKLQQRDIAISEILASDSINRLIESFAYRELYLRQRINEAVKAVMIATAQPDDLVALFNLFDVNHLTGKEKNTYEEFYKSLRSFETVGSVEAYSDQAKQADSRVKGVYAANVANAQVNVAILSIENDGAASNELITVVQDYLRHDQIRPITDYVTVQSAEIIHYRITATLTLFNGPGIESVKTAAQQAIRNFITQHHVLGQCITRAGIKGALHQAGVIDVELTLSQLDENNDPQPVVGNIIVSATQAAFCDINSEQDIVITTQVLTTASELPPVELPKAIEFIDQDSDAETLTGSVIIYPAEDETVITDYVLYWASVPNRALTEIVTLPVTGEPITYQFPLNTVIPEGANYLLAVTKNQYGEMLIGYNLALTENNNNG